MIRQTVVSQIYHGKPRYENQEEKAFKTVTEAI